MINYHYYLGSYEYVIYFKKDHTVEGKPNFNCHIQTEVIKGLKTQM